MRQVEKFPPIMIRIERNADGNHVLWSLRCDDGTMAKGFARTKREAVAKAMGFLDAMATPGQVYSGPTLVANNAPPEAS